MTRAGSTDSPGRAFLETLMGWETPNWELAGASVN